MSTGIKIIYDGECPFCSRYVMMTNLRQSVGDVELINLRSGHPLVREIQATGLDLNEGMLARYGGKDYFGADCMHLLSLLSSRDTMMERTVSRIFSNEKLAHGLYPFLRFGRNLTLKLLGRKK